MRIIVTIVFIAALGLGVWWLLGKKQEAPAGPQAKPLAVSQHSEGFNASVDSMLTQYYRVAEALVNWDSAGASLHAEKLHQVLQQVRLTELPDSNGLRLTARTFIDNATNDANRVAAAGNLEAQRRALAGLTENMYNFLRVVRYDREKTYLQECPMAFNDTEAAMWLSRLPDIRNPYLGNRHPRYGKAMLNCGEVKETLNYTGAD